MIGSVEYAAPEQIKGQAIFASDLYSLGVTCLCLLTQMRPFDLYDIAEDDWKWQAYLPYPISSDLKAILCKLLQPAIRRRYQSVTEVLADLNSSVVLTTRQRTDSATSQLSSSTDPSLEMSKPFNGLMKKLQVRCSNLFDKDAVELVFTIMLIFMLTCIGSMLMICFFFEMEKRAMDQQSLPQTEVQSPFALSAPGVSAQSQ
jgi:serine/threonine protein kinase